MAQQDAVTKQLMVVAKDLARGQERVISMHGEHEWSLGASIWLERLRKRARGCGSCGGTGVVDDPPFSIVSERVPCPKCVAPSP